MRILLIHPEDELLDGPWADSKWDGVLDLGHAGSNSYARASAILGAAVTPLRDLRGGFAGLRRVRELLASGLGRLTDSFGLDWWELTAILIHQQLETVILLEEFVKTLSPQDEIYVSRPGFHANALTQWLGASVHAMVLPRNRRKRSADHYLRLWKKFPVSQLLEIFWDKYDPGYQLRGPFTSSRKSSGVPLVLLPSAYVNVSRTGLAYAAGLPDAHFLLVATRRSGWVENPPPNVTTAWLRSYASIRSADRKSECADLLARWILLRREVESIPEFRVISKLGCFDDFPRHFAKGLEMRDAWSNVLRSEPVQSAISADDSNPFTHIPLLLAKQMGLPTISCHHGALDGRCMFKRNHADVVLAKGKMEEDYLVRLCGLPAEQVKIGAPAARTEIRGQKTANPAIVLFSEPYEAMGGRVRNVYEDILPPLADLALAKDCELIVKLHPAESVTERSRMIAEILQPRQQQRVRIVSGALQQEMLDNAWFGITILSTSAVECALRGVPCFLCKWLESSPYGYIDQFIQFGAGIALHHPQEIAEIPRMIGNYRPSRSVDEDCGKTVDAARLTEWLGLNGRQPLRECLVEDIAK
jgi:hypothetical protein